MRERPRGASKKGMTTTKPTPQARRPLIAVPACIKQIEGAPFHSVQDKYLRAVVEAAGATPLVVPAYGAALELEALLDAVDGVLLTGSPSNVHPTHYGRAADPRAEPHDEERDATTLPLIRLALAREVPLFAICRGLQELNVALGGTLHAQVQDLPGRMDHRRPENEPDLDIQYGARHSIEITPGGVLERILDTREAMVNSLHGQAVETLAEDLAVEAVAEDGTIEAVSVTTAGAFALGVQWHPEYKAAQNPLSVRLFEAFGTAARTRAATRTGALETAKSRRAAE